MPYYILLLLRVSNIPVVYVQLCKRRAKRSTANPLICGALPFFFGSSPRAKCPLRNSLRWKPDLRYTRHSFETRRKKTNVCNIFYLQIALEGLRVSIPPGSSPHITKLIRICMNEDPGKRPTFDMITPILEKMKLQ